MVQNEGAEVSNQAVLVGEVIFCLSDPTHLQFLLEPTLSLVLRAIQILCTKQTASDYQVGRFHPAPTNWNQKHLLAEKEWTYFSSNNPKQKKNIKSVSPWSYLHHFMVWSHISLNTCQIRFFSLFWHFQSQLLSNSCINRSRWFHGGTIETDDFVANFKLKTEKSTLPVRILQSLEYRVTS
jgi:hypothetical protein